MISHKHKFIFIHPNKCGGKSIESLLFGVQSSPGSADHRSLISQISEIGEGSGNLFFKFGFCRNPWDRLVSIYHGRRQILKDKNTRELSFGDFILSLDLQRMVYPVISKYWFLKKDGNIGLDFIGRFENFQEDFNFICDKIGIPRQELSRINKSKHKHYTEYYDDETKQIVAEKYAKDIEHFGYEFGK